MEPILERRNLLFPEIITRAEPTDDAIRISGYGSVFDRSYEVFNVKETVAPGAFTKTLKDNPDIRGMFNHDPNYLLGRTKSGTMSVEEDSRGLKYEILASKSNPQSVSVADMIQRGDVNGSSMAFFVHKDEWETDKKGNPTKRIIKEVELIETGPVAIPASPSTSAKVKRANEFGYDGILGFRIVLERAGFKLSREALERLLLIEAPKDLEAEPQEHSAARTLAGLRARQSRLDLRERMIATL